MRSTVTKYQEFDSPQAYFVADVAITRLLLRAEIIGWRQHLKAKITVPWLLLLVLLLLLLLLLWWFSFLVLSS